MHGSVALLFSVCISSYFLTGPSKAAAPSTFILLNIGSVMSRCAHSDCRFLVGPGTAALENRRAIASAYDAMAIEAYLRHSGCSASYSVRHTDTAVEEYWTVA